MHDVFCFNNFPCFGDSVFQVWQASSCVQLIKASQMTVACEKNPSKSLFYLPTTQRGRNIVLMKTKTKKMTVTTHARKEEWYTWNLHNAHGASTWNHSPLGSAGFSHDAKKIPLVASRGHEKSIKIPNAQGRKQRRRGHQKKTAWDVLFITKVKDHWYNKCTFVNSSTLAAYRVSWSVLALDKRFLVYFHQKRLQPRCWQCRLWSEG